MNIDNLTIKEAREIAALFNAQRQIAAQFDNGMIGKYVVVRCRDAGVHAGVLEAHQGRECVLTDSRRLWYWEPANKSKSLSGVALYGLAEGKIGEALPRIHLTENCEIIECSTAAERSIREYPANE